MISLGKIAEARVGFLSTSCLKSRLTRFFLAAVAVCAGFDPAMTGAREPDATPDELPRIPAVEPTQAGATLDVEPGFRAVLAASEPLVADPVAMCFDERGRLFVVEMRGYSERRDEHLGSVRLLEDPDGDGVFDRSTVFADGLNWPTAIICWDGGIFLGMTPDIVWMKDTDGDNVADVRRTIFTGFGSDTPRLNVQAMINSFRWGLDNRIHGATAGNGGTITRPARPEFKPVPLRGRDFSFDPVSLDLRRENVTAQHGMSFDNWGRKFTCSNSDHIQTFMHRWHDVASRLSIAADGPAAEVFRLSPDEPWRIVRTRWRIAGSVGGPVEGGGRVSGYFTSASGVTIYRGDAWPDEYLNNAFVGDVGSNLIHRKMVMWKDGLPSATRSLNDRKREFIASTDNWFRPVQFENGPDGCLYAADMYREVIEHPWSLPANIKQFLDLNSGNDRGRIYRIQPEHYSPEPLPDLSRHSPAQLIPLLGHSNAWHRETAARMIYNSQSLTLTGQLRQSLQPDSPGARNPLFVLHAAMALNGLEKLDSEDLLKLIRHCISQNHPDFDNVLYALLDHFASPQSHLELNHRGQLVEAVFMDYRQRGLPVPEQIVPQLLLGSMALPDSSDVRIDLCASLLPASTFTLGLTETVAGRESLRIAGQLMQAADSGPGPHTQAVLKRLGNISGKSVDSEQRFSQAWNMAANRTGIDRMAAWQAGLMEGMRQSDRGRTILKSNSQSIAERAREIMPANSRVDRGVVIDFLMVQPDPGLINTFLESVIESSEFGEVLSLMDNRTPAASWNFILQNLHRLSSSILPEAVRKLAASPVAIDFLRQLKNNPDPAMLAQIPVSQVQQWRRVHQDGPTGNLVAALFGNPPQEDRQAVIDDYVNCLGLEASASRGKAVYLSQCAACHASGDEGFSVGPDIQTMKAMGSERLLVHILDPNREVQPGYIAWQVESIGGDSWLGLLSSQGENSIELLLPGAEKVSIPNGQIVSSGPTGRSLMTVGFESTLSAQDLADLIRFIESR